MEATNSSTTVINVGTKTPDGNEGHFVRFADGIIAKIEGTHGTWIDTYPVVDWNQHGSRFDALIDYSKAKIAATVKMAEGF